VVPVEIIRIAAVGIAAAALSVVVKRDNPAFSLMIAIAASLVIIAITLPWLRTAAEFATDMAGRVSASVPYAPALLKVIGISYIAEFGAQVCADAGEHSIASRVEFGGKALILAVSAPVILELLDGVLGRL
jgi:stage III sporulation protein AD